PVNEAAKLAQPDRVLKLANRLGLDLAHALAGDLEDAADLLERVGVSVADAVAELEYLPLAVGEGAKHLFDALLEHVARSAIGGRALALIFDEVAEVALLAIANGAVQ